MKNTIKKVAENKLLLLTLLFYIIVGVSVAAFFLYVAMHALKGPVSLTETEIAYYTEVAKTVWNDDAITIDEPFIKCNTKKDNVTISSYNIFKESVTVYFSESSSEVVINEPNVSFTGCFIFHVVLAIASIVGSIWYTLHLVKELVETPNK